MQAGHPLLTDDILPVEQVAAGRWLGLPGYPAMRMWPDEAEHFLGHHEDLEIVHPQLDKRRVAVGHEGFGAFCAEAQPLACIYIPERRDPALWGNEVEIMSLRPTVAFIEVVRNSFTPRIVEALGWQRSCRSCWVTWCRACRCDGCAIRAASKSCRRYGRRSFEIWKPRRPQGDERSSYAKTGPMEERLRATYLTTPLAASDSASAAHRLRSRAAPLAGCDPPGWCAAR